MKYARALSNYSHRGLTKVRDANNLHPLFDLVQPGWCFPCVYGYDERSEAQLKILERFGIVEFVDAPEKAEIAPQYFDDHVLPTLPDEFKAAYVDTPKQSKQAETSSEDQEQD